MATVTRMSASKAEAFARVRALYRHVQRNVPNVVRAYELEVDEKLLRDVMRNKFRIHSEELETATIDVMCWKGEMELQETVEMWKTKAHVQRYVNETRPASADFVRDFYNPVQTIDEWH